MGSQPIPKGRTGQTVTVAGAIGASGLAVQPFQRRFLERAFAPGVSVAALAAARGSGKTELILR